MKSSILLGAYMLTVASALSRRSEDDGFCRPGQSCFPSDAVIAQFNASISGRLHSQRPVGAVCYEGDPSFNQAACEALANQTSSGNWRIAHFPTYQYIASEICSSTENCNATTVVRDRVCAQGRIPDYAVHAETTQDVVKYVRFATKHNLRIVIKNTGHDLLARSSGQGGFALWTHKMKDMQFNETFVPEGCSKKIDGGVMTVEAGVQWGEAYKFADTNDRIVIGGGAATVGAAGGFPVGGGYSLLSPSLGLGLHNMVEIELVTADGQLRTVNECSHPDLFWAVRGGGGGTWGVTTKVTYKTHPRDKLYIAFFDALSPNMTDAVAREAIARWVKLAPVLGDIGVGGATTLSGKSLVIGGFVQSSFANLTQLKKTLEPFTSWLADQGILKSDLETTASGSPIYASYANWNDYFFSSTNSGDEVITGSTAGGGSRPGLPSRLVPRHYYESDPEELADILFEGGQAGQVIIGMNGPLRYLKDHPTVVNTTSINPVWYQSPWHIMGAGVDRLREFAKDGGAYFGESDAQEPDAANVYWGSNYPALLRAKAKWDPKNAFQVWHGVGSSTLGNGTQSVCF